MLKRLLLAATAAAALLALPAAANDGFAGMTATGLEFSKTDAIAMQSEDLKIGLDKITVDYVFKNTSDADVSGTVAFPMPVFGPSTFQFSPTQFVAADIDKENPVDFTATVDGQAVAVKAEKRAFEPKPLVENPDPEAPYVPPPASAEYDEPGTDITDYLTSLGIPISYDPEKIMAAIDKLTPAQQKELIDRNLVGDGRADNIPETRWVVGWTVQTRYYWDQTFKAGAEVKISHSYQTHPSGGLFYWYDWTAPTADWETDPNGEDKKRFCISGETGEAIKAALPADPEQGGSRHGTLYFIQYVLTTAHTWKGPIGAFKLTLDKGDEKNVLSTCMEGLTATGPTSYTVEKTNYSPDKDLEIMVITADPAFKE